MMWLRLTIFVILATFATLTVSQNANQYRLPDNHKPNNYTLHLHLDPEDSGYVGTLIINFSTQKASKFIQLHATPNHIIIKEVILNSADICTVSYVSNETEIANITCPSEIQRSEHNNVLIRFSGVFKQKIRGLYKQKYKYNNITEYFLATQFESAFARRAFPCFDEPQLKAVFDVTIMHPQNCVALSNSAPEYQILENT